MLKVAKKLKSFVMYLGLFPFICCTGRWCGDPSAAVTQHRDAFRARSPGIVLFNLNIFKLKKKISFPKVQLSKKQV